MNKMISAQDYSERINRVIAACPIHGTYHTQKHLGPALEYSCDNMPHFHQANNSK